MRVTVVALGTRGDVTPCVALGTRLRAEGHTVRVATFAEFEGLVRGYELDYHRVPGSFQELIATREGRSALGVPRASPLGMAAILKPFQHCADAVFAECWAACSDADVVAASNVGMMPAIWIARARGLLFVHCQAVPSIVTRRLPHNSFPPWRLGPLYNQMTHRLAARIGRRGGSRVLEAWREAARRLAPDVEQRRGTMRYLALVAASPTVVPRPDDWPQHAHITGYWFLPEGPPRDVPGDLRDFVEAGSPPVCLGFGSMGDNDPDQLREIVFEVLHRLRLRAVVVGGSGEALTGFEGSDLVRSVPFVDYDWLFPRMGAVVHQGGAGTAAFCLTAGVPQVCVPYCLDHRFWSWRMEVVGVAPPPVIRHRLTVGRLADRLRRAVAEPGFRGRAGELAPRIRAENGLARATRLIERYFGFPQEAPLAAKR
jgi:UDP:flavonoid glycosyltransferase YjiC (YdhE family)